MRVYMDAIHLDVFWYAVMIVAGVRVSFEVGIVSPICSPPCRMSPHQRTNIPYDAHGVAVCLIVFIVYVWCIPANAIRMRVGYANASHVLGCLQHPTKRTRCLVLHIFVVSARLFQMYMNTCHASHHMSGYTSVLCVTYASMHPCSGYSSCGSL
jgi:hypothetical protein